jgi:hypothetical protein
VSSVLVIVIPLALTIVGIMWLNSFNLVDNQLEYTLEQDPIIKSAAEHHANDHGDG